MKLQNKVALVTGASRGIGAATAKLLAEEGAKVVIDYFVSDYEPNAAENAEAVKEEIVRNGGEAITVATDVSDEAQVKNLIKQVVDHFGTIDIVVNNAGIVFDVPIKDRTAEQWQTTFNTNVHGVYLVSKAVSEHMRQNKSGKIINISSTSGIDALNPESIDYDATKAGIVTLTKNFAQHLAPYVNVNAVAPGWVDTEMNKDLPSDFIEKETKKIFLDRLATPEEIAKIILFLASDDASYLNGSVIIADGGRGY